MNIDVKTTGTLQLVTSTLYKVDYRITKTSSDQGEFSADQIGERLTHISVSDDVGEVFIDLCELHREDYLVGLEILGISK
jgi:hypothetical protein